MLSLLAGVIFLVGAAPAPQAARDAADASSDYLRFDALRYRDRIEADGSVSKTIEAKVFLKTASAVAEFGQIGFPYVDGYGDVQFEKVTIEKPDGRTIEVKNGLVEDVNPFGVTGTSVAADIRFKKLTIPGLEPRDRLNYMIMVRRKPFTPGGVFGEMKFPPMLGDPAQVYELDIPRAAGIRVRLREGLGATWKEVPAPSDRLVRRLSLRIERPASDSKKLGKRELEAWTEPDIIFTSFATWGEVARWWWGLSRGRLVPDASIKAEAARLAASKATAREKIEALHAFAATQIRYINVSFGLGRMQPRAAASVLENRYGDCKDKHALLAALAASVGVDVRPALIHSSRSHLHDDVPGPQQFDHMISVAQLGPDPADWLWLDATNPLGPPGYLTPVLRGKRALLIGASGEGHVVETPAEPPFVSKTVVEVKGSLEADGRLKGHAVWSLRSDQEVAWRAGFAASPQDGRAEMVQRGFADDWKGGKVTNVTVSDPMDVREAFRIEFDVERPAPGTPNKEDWSLWIPLPEFSLPKPDESEDAAGEALKVLPSEFRASADITIPEGLRAHAPLSLSLDRSFGRFLSTYSADGTQLGLTRILTFSGHSVPEAERTSYEAFRKAIGKDRDQCFSMMGGLTPGPAASAVTLHTEGVAAFGRKEYAKAVELLRNATETDPKIKDGFVDLGRALREESKRDEAMLAFTRQIELDPLHETAYAERAQILFDEDRLDDAEKDFLKQIEVAPFKALSYTRLGQRRMLQLRYGDAADFFSKAATLEPAEAARWTDLARARQMEGRADEARAALERFRALDSTDWVKFKAARIYNQLGDLSMADDLAAKALPYLGDRLAALSPDTFDENALDWVDYLAEAWNLLGFAAVAAGNDAKAERYLDAAWKLDFRLEAAWALGNLREKQGRLAEAVDLWSLASSVPGADVILPAGHEDRIAEARRRARAPEWRPERMVNLRTVRIPGPVVADLTEEVLVLAGRDGRVERIRGLSPRKASELNRQIASLGAVRLDIAAPDDGFFKVVRRGLLACHHLTDCSLVLDLPGQTDAVPTLQASLHLEKLDPPNQSILHRGQRVTMVVVMAYTFPSAVSDVLAVLGQPSVTLMVLDQTGRSLLQPRPAAAMPGQVGKASLTGTFDVPQDATRIDVFVSPGLLGEEPAKTPAMATYTVGRE